VSADVSVASYCGDDLLVEVDGLSIEFPTKAGWARVVEDVSFEIIRREAIGLVGESGSGKTVTSLALLGLTAAQGGRVASGTVRVAGTDVTKSSEARLAVIRGREIGVIFQHALHSLDPAFTVGQQISEVVRRHTGMSRKAAMGRAIELLNDVHIPEADRRARDYPHQFSGGMLQRAMIAMALSCDPQLLIADEPTTALDVTVQAQILDLLREVQERAGTAIVLVSHNLAVIAEMCDRVAVMYAGQVVEQGNVEDVFLHPAHPYTEGLLGSVPRRGKKLRALPGNVPIAPNMPAGCRFHPRCQYVIHGRCDKDTPGMMSLRRQLARCVRADELDLSGTDL
jgi:peptide/nickel transport system ATP-binding protein/oligopeptide transport system ATP-binding protein